MASALLTGIGCGGSAATAQKCPTAGKGLAALVAAGYAIAGAFSTLAEQLGRIAEERSTSGPALLAKGLKATAGLVPATADIDNKRRRDPADYRA